MHFACDDAEHNALQPFLASGYAADVPYSTPRHIRRRENLRQLCEEAGGVTQLALLIDTPKSHVSAILNGRRGVGDQLAGKIEKRMGKRLGWLDEPHTETGDIFDPALPCIAEVLDVSDQGWNMLVDFEQLPPAKRAEIAAMVQDEARQWRTLAAEVLKTYTPLGQPGAPALPPQVRPPEEHTHRVVRLPDDVAPDMLRLPHTKLPDHE